jgi:hypothetical protein
MTTINPRKECIKAALTTILLAGTSALRKSKFYAMIYPILKEAGVG